MIGCAGISDGRRGMRGVPGRLTNRPGEHRITQNSIGVQEQGGPASR